MEPESDEDYGTNDIVPDNLYDDLDEDFLTDDLEPLDHYIDYYKVDDYE